MRQASLPSHFSTERLLGVRDSWIKPTIMLSGELKGTADL